MSLPAATTWEVRATGADTNGGGFVTGASGTDYSQQNAAQFSGTDLASTNGNAASPVVTSATHNFVATDVGNLINISAGTSWTPGIYQIVSVATNAATLDRACGSAATLSGGTWAEGGALGSPGMAAGAKVGGNVVYWQSGTYTLTTASTNVSGGPVNDSTSGAYNAPNVWVGYSTTRTIANTDATRPVISVPNSSTYNGITAFLLGGAYCGVRNLNVTFQGSTPTNTIGIKLYGGYSCIMDRCKVSGATKYGIEIDGGSTYAIRCEATGGSGTGGFHIGNSGNQGQGFAVACEAYANTVTGFYCETGGRMIDCLSYGNTGGSSYGFYSFGSLISGCVAYGNGSHGFNSGFKSGGVLMINCLAENNTGWGFYNGNQQGGTDTMLNCGAYNNTSGAYNAVEWLAAENFVTNTTGTFFVNAASNNFALNSTANQGTLARAAGFPGAFPRGTTTGYRDIGAVQHQDPVSGPGGVSRARVPNGS